ncbi:MAG: hypothetical protein U0M60_05885 [Clostridia bacterium]|nr:hypothetical protein [Clostridia bacterium]
MKMRRFLVTVLSAIMILTMSVPAFAATYVINEFDSDYVICTENFAGGEISNNIVVPEGEYSLLDGGVELRAGGSLKADLAAEGKSVSSGIVDVSFSFTPGIDAGIEINNVATQRFDFGGGFSLEAKWTEFGSNSAWLKDGKFLVGGQELIKFNSDGTGYEAGYFRSIGQESAAPSLYYKIDARINLDTGKLYLTITEEETSTTDYTEEVIIDNKEYDYTSNTFDAFTNTFTATNDYYQFFSYNYHLDITIDGDASYEGVSGTVTRSYPENYSFQKDSYDYLTFDPSGNHEHFVDLSEKAVTSGTVNISYRFWPSMSSGSDKSIPATQTFEFGPGFKFNAQWTGYGQNATWIKDGRFNIGDQTIVMNASRWNIGDFPAGMFRAYNIWDNGIVWNTTAPHAYYDISAKVNLDTKKVYLTIEEHLEIVGNGNDVQADEKVTKILDNAEFDYKANVLNYYKNSLDSVDTFLRSYNSSLLIQADGITAYDSADDVPTITYPENSVFVNEGSLNEIFEDKEVGYYGYYKNEKVADLSKTPISKGIVDVSYRFQPNLYWGAAELKEATQTFEFGEGFKFDAKWSSYGGNAAWMVNCHFEIGEFTKFMNSAQWNIADFPAGYLRVYNIHGTADWNTASPYGYYDISAKINLDTKKVYLTIVEHLNITTGTEREKVTTLM